MTAELIGHVAEIAMLGFQVCVAAIPQHVGAIRVIQRFPRGSEVGFRLQGRHAGVSVEGCHSRRLVERRSAVPSPGKGGAGRHRKRQNTDDLGTRKLAAILLQADVACGGTGVRDRRVSCPLFRRRFPKGQYRRDRLVATVASGPSVFITVRKPTLWLCAISILKNGGF